MAATDVGSARGDVLRKSPFAAKPAELIALARKVPVEDSPPVVVLLESGRLRFDKQGRRTHTLHRIYQIKSVDGVASWSQTSASWAPWFQHKPEIRARVIEPDGTEHQLAKSALIEDKQPSGSAHLYSDRRSLRAPLPSTSVGVIVEEQIVTREHRRYFDSGGVFHFYIGGTVPWFRARFVIDAPKRLRVKTTIRNIKGVRRQVNRRAGRVITTFSKRDVAPYDYPESHLAPDERRAARITTSIGSWKGMAKQYAGIVDDAIAAGPVNALVATLKGASPGGRDARIIAALKLVSDNVRYTGLELGESAIVPFSPAETWKRKYGDCKDKATLLVALLRGLGVRAHVALIRSSYGENLEPGAPGLGAFNHAIVYVEKAGAKSAAWIDPTEELTRFGDLPQSDQGRYALIARQGETSVVKTPILSAAKNYKREVREISLPEEGLAKVTETTVLGGAMEVGFRRYLRDSKPSDIKKHLESYFGNEYNDAKLLAHRHGAPSSLETPLELYLSGKNAKIAAAARHDASVYLDLSRVLDSLPSALTSAVSDKEKPRKREMFVFPRTREVVWRIRAPVGFRVREPPAPSVEKFGPLELQVSYQRKKRELVVKARLRVISGRFKPSEVLAFRRRANDSAKNEVNLTIDQVGMRAMKSDKLKEAAIEIRRLIQLHPREALHHVQLSEIYFEAGLGGPARAEANKAVKVEPGSSLAHDWLGFVLSHDALGRWLEPGSNKRRATAAFKKAIKLDPTLITARRNLGVILEYSSAGIRYEGDLEGAIEVYQANRKENADKDFDLNLLLALFRAKRWAEALELGREMPPTDVVGGLRLGAAMMLGGVKQLRQEVAKVNDRSGASIRSASLELAQAGKYAQAAMVFGEGIRSGVIPETQRSYQKFLASMRRFRPAKATPSNISTLLTSAAMLRRPRDREVVAPVPTLHDPILAARIGDRNGIAEHFFVDLVASIAKSNISRVPAWGWRVNMSMDAPGSGLTTWTLFVQKNRGKLRVVGTETWLDNVALGVLKLVKQNKIADARTLVRWLVEASKWNASLKALAADLDKSSKKELMAAAVSALSESTKKGVSMLRDCSQIPAAKLDACHRSLAAAAFFARDFERARSNAASVVPTSNEKAGYMILRATIEERDGKRAAADRLLAALEASEGRTAAVTVALADQRLSRGDLDGAIALYKESAAKESTVSTANMIAWLSLFKDSTSDSLIGQLRKATGPGSRNYQNTLAAMYAHRGRLRAARAALRASVAGLPGEEPQDHLVLGRIAAELGLKSEARRHYKTAIKKTTKAKKADNRFSSWKLAQMWMKEL